MRMWREPPLIANYNKKNDKHGCWNWNKFDSPKQNWNASDNDNGNEPNAKGDWKRTRRNQKEAPQAKHARSSEPKNHVVKDIEVRATAVVVVAAAAAARPKKVTRKTVTTVDPRTPPARPPRIREVATPRILRSVHGIGDVADAAALLTAVKAVTRRRRRTPVVLLLQPTVVVVVHYWPDENDRDHRLARFPHHRHIRDPADVRHLHRCRRRRLVLQRVLVRHERRNECVIRRIGRAVAHPLRPETKVPVPMKRTGANDDDDTVEVAVMMMVAVVAETTPSGEKNPPAIRHRRTKHRDRPSQKRQRNIPRQLPQSTAHRRTPRRQVYPREATRRNRSVRTGHVPDAVDRDPCRPRPVRRAKRTVNHLKIHALARKVHHPHHRRRRHTNGTETGTMTARNDPNVLHRALSVRATATSSNIPPSKRVTRRLSAAMIDRGVDRAHQV